MARWVFCNAALFLFIPSFDHYIYSQAVGAYNDYFVHHDEFSHQLSQQCVMEKTVRLDTAGQSLYAVLTAPLYNTNEETEGHRSNAF